MSFVFSRCLGGVLSRQAAPSRLLLEEHKHAAQSLWFSPVVTLKTSAPLRSYVMPKKKRVDPRIEQVARDRMKRKLKRLERIPPEFIPIEDFIPSARRFDETKQRDVANLSFEESERRALLYKEWNLYKMEQFMAEMKAIKLALEAQRQALEELKVESDELYQAALKPDPLLFPFTHEGPVYTPPIPDYYPPDGKLNDATPLYTQYTQ